MSLKNELKCEGHEEADTKFAFFISKLSGPKNVAIKCSDTDILIIILGNMSNFDQSLQIFIKFGTGSNVRFIDTTKISKELGPEVCGALPAFHAFTGCDYNPSFYRKAKTKPFELLLTSVEYQDAFLNIHDCQYHSTIERFVCDLYATQKNKLRNEVSVNAARVQLFNMNYSVVDDLENFKEEVVNFDACMLPPTQRELEQHISRTKYIASVWCNATLPIPSSLDPLLHGWELSDNGKLTFHWFDGDEMPEFVEEVLLQPETDTESNIDEAEENVISDESESDNDSDSESIESDDSFESSRESESEQ